MKTCCQILPVLLAVIAIASCGGNQPGTMLQEELQAPPQIGEAVQYSGSMPALDELDGELRDVSAAGLGWYGLNLRATGGMRRNGGVSLDGDALQFTAGDQPAWQIWSLGGLGLDLLPSAFSTEVSDMSGEYFIAVADYGTGRWRWSGPYTENTQLDHYPLSGSPPFSELLSGINAHHVAVLATPGSSFRLDAASIRLQDDGSAPLPTELLLLTPGEDSVSVQWIGSASQGEPDFAGYYVERAPESSGEFVTLYADPQKNTHYIDKGVTPGTLYRYRVASVDLEGNRAVSEVQTGGPEAGGNVPPVCIVDVDPGPYEGTSTISLDLSGSYDADGEPIEDYLVIDVENLTAIEQVSPYFELELDAGCHRLMCYAQNTSGTGSYVQNIRIYPRWQPEPSLAVHPMPIASRYAQTVIGYNPDDGNNYILRTDKLGNTLELEVRNGQTVLTVQRVLLEADELTLLSDPVFHDGQMWFLASTLYGQLLLSSDGTNLVEQAIPEVPGSNDGPASIVSTGDSLVLVRTLEAAVGVSIQAIELGSGQFRTLAEEAYIGWSAASDPANGHFELLYSKDGEVACQVFNSELDLVDTLELGSFGYFSIDLALAPASGDRFVVCRDISDVWLAFYDSNLQQWTEPSPAPAAPAAEYIPEIMLDEGVPFVAFVDSQSSLDLYLISEGIWDHRGQLSTQCSADTLASCSAAGQDGLLVHYDVETGNEYLIVTDINGSTQLLDTIKHISHYKGLTACASDDKLVIAMTTKQDGWWTTGIGASFQPLQTRAGVDSIQCFSDRENAYISTSSGDDAYMMQIDGGTLELIQDLQMQDAGARPIVGSGLDSVWYCDETDQPDPLVGFYSGNSMPIVVDTSRIWCGNLAGFEYGHVLGPMVYGGTESGIGNSVGLYDGKDESIELLFPADRHLSLEDGLADRRMDSTWFRNSIFQPLSLTYIASGASRSPVRIVHKPQGSTVSTELPLTGSDWTVSCGKGLNEVEVSLLASTDGHRRYMEWDNFGAFEQLAMPDTGWSDQHEIVIGHDGRWHIVYHNLETDSIMVWSTE
ncbi:fibronectin type III domain-containing protein [bacterium]|nr:fibronectin type III domain-containing protein [bacterium]